MIWEAAKWYIVGGELIAAFYVWKIPPVRESSGPIPWQVSYTLAALSLVVAFPVVLYVTYRIGKSK